MVEDAPGRNEVLRVREHATLLGSTPIAIACDAQVEESSSSNFQDQIPRACGVLPVVDDDKGGVGGDERERCCLFPHHCMPDRPRVSASYRCYR